MLQCKVIVYQPTIQILYKSNLQSAFKFGKFDLPRYHETYYSVESTCTVQYYANNNRLI